MAKSEEEQTTEGNRFQQLQEQIAKMSERLLAEKVSFITFLEIIANFLTGNIASNLIAIKRLSLSHRLLFNLHLAMISHNVSLCHYSHFVH